MKKIIVITFCIIFTLTLCGCKSEPPQQSSYSYVETVEVSSKEESSKIESNSSKNKTQDKTESPGINAASSTSSKTPSVVTYVVPDNTATIDEENDFYGTTIARISSDKVKALPSGMTYREIIATLGESSSAGYINGYYEYVVDDDNLLMLHFEKGDDICSMSGEELLKTLVPLKSHLNDEKKNTVYAVVINDYCKVSCPNYKDFSCAGIITKNAKITFANGKAATKDDIKQGHTIIIKYDMVLESYPPQVVAEEIIIQ